MMTRCSQSSQDGVRTMEDETVSSLDGTDYLGAAKDRMDGRRWPSTTDM